ncbi:MAG TPA: hypothetical protein VG308_01940 [Stellaceae bacterium]|jgi:hypothetical protein|nr:hypothetical protein [Stellaceae bacterium]
MSATRATTLAGTLATLLTSAAAEADTVKTPDCQRDLAMANRLVTAIAAREKQFVKGDLARNCALLRQNLVDLVKAREPMDRCITGHDHGENLGQIDASIEDVRAVLAEKCGK